MPVAIDTSVLVEAERGVDFLDRLAALDDLIYIPAHAAVEFLVGTHPPVRIDLRERARRIYDSQFRDIVLSFSEQDAVQLAALNAELKQKGQTMKWYDAAIAATVLARGDSLLALDGDYDRLKDRIHLLVL